MLLTIRFNCFCKSTLQRCGGSQTRFVYYPFSSVNKRIYPFAIGKYFFILRLEIFDFLMNEIAFKVIYVALYIMAFLCFWLPYKGGNKFTGIGTSSILIALICFNLSYPSDLFSVLIIFLIFLFSIFFLFTWSFILLRRRYLRKLNKKSNESIQNNNFI